MESVLNLTTVFEGGKCSHQTERVMRERRRQLDADQVYAWAWIHNH